MLYKVYLDEANTGTKNPDMTVAGYLGAAPQWRHIERELRAIKRRLGFGSFHGVDFKGRRGDFRGWTDEQGMELINALVALTREKLTEAIEITLPHQLYAEHYRNTPFEKWMPVYSQYGICIYTLLEHLARQFEMMPGHNRLDLIVEDGHKNAGAARVVFSDMKKFLEFKGMHFFGTVSVVKKKDSELLMMADFQAHASGVVAIQLADPNATVVGQTNFPTGRSDEGIVTSISHSPRGLQSIKDRFTWLRNAKMAAARAKRRRDGSN